ncbi:MAG: acetyl-CoA carboxylase biotin carboxyl carrier protein subunit, partial [Pseudomonadota bacterium]
ASLIEAPMPGLLKELNAKPGDEVVQGDRLAVLEAMKMEHSLLSPRDGVVAEVLSQAGAQVKAGAALIRLHDVEA